MDIEIWAVPEFPTRNVRRKDGEHRECHRCQLSAIFGGTKVDCACGLCDSTWGRVENGLVGGEGLVGVLY
jgi:hypothetical protein